MSSRLFMWIAFPKFRQFHKKRDIATPVGPSVHPEFKLYIDPNDPRDAEMRARWQEKRDAYDNRPSALD